MTEPLRLVDRLAATGDHAARVRLLRRAAAHPGADAALTAAIRGSDPCRAAVYGFHLAMIRRCRAVGAQRPLVRHRATTRRVHLFMDRGVAALRRYRAEGDAADLDAAVAMFATAADLAVAGHPDRPTVLSNLGLALLDRQGDLDRAVDVLEEALSLAPRADRLAPLANLGIALLARRRVDATVDDFERAVSVLTEAAGVAVAPDRSQILGNLGVALSERYRRSGSERDLTGAVTAYDAAADAATGAERIDHRANLATGLAERWQILGRPEDLDRAVEIARTVVGGTDGGADLTDRVGNLALILRDRFQRDGAFVDLDEAVDRLRTAVSIVDRASRAAVLDQLAVTVRVRAGYQRDAAGLADAVDLHRRAAADADETIRMVVFTNLGGTLRAWAAATDDLAALSEAIDCYREGVGLVTSAADRCAALTNLSSGLIDRYDALGRREDLVEAVDVLTVAVADTDDRSPDLPARLNSFANALRRRHALSGDPADAERVVAAYRAGADLGSRIAVEAGLRCALNWGRWEARQSEWTSAAEAFTAARVVADRLLRVHPVRRHAEAWLGAVGDLAMLASFTAVRTSGVEDAAAWLEWGRARILSDTLQRDRADLARLEAVREPLARRYRAAVARVGRWRIS